MQEYINKIINADCLDILKQLPDKCVDLVLTDPPYGYLNVGFDKEYFDVKKVFSELVRVLKSDGLFVFSGRGDTFFEQNIVLKELGLPFKEEIVWNKKANTTPFLPIRRVHELIAIRGNGTLNKVRVGVEDSYDSREDLILAIKRAITSIKNKPEEFIKLVKTGKLERKLSCSGKFNITVSKDLKNADRGLVQASSFLEGFTVKSIITESRDSVYKGIHPTQKPVKLFEKMIEICSNENDLVLDCFSGSGTTAVACHNLKRRFICIEKDPDYWRLSCERLEQAQRQQMLF